MNEPDSFELPNGVVAAVRPVEHSKMKDLPELTI